MSDLSVIVPARNEMFLSRTVDDVLSHIESDTEIIVILDGAPADPPLPTHPRLRVIDLPQSIGQRAATNLGVRASSAKYVMKLDAHCSVGQGFDRIMLADMQPDWTMVPKMYNLHAFDWLCTKCGTRRYQGPSGVCQNCGGETVRDILWKAKHNPESTAMRFDRDLHFQYWSAYKKQQHGDLVETMSLLGACWLLERERYWDLNICDEAHGSWGQMGTEVACKSWLSGGKLICTKKTWFAHLFRTQGGDFGFPYPISGHDVDKARSYSRKLWIDGTWPKAKYPLSWLIKKFAPVPGWEGVELEREEAKDLSKGIIYYTDNRLDPLIMSAVQSQLSVCSNGHDLVTVSLQPLSFGRNFTLDAERGALTLHKQILAGLEASKADIIYFSEHDVLYHPSHFQFTPPRRDTFYYNTNVWKVRYPDGHAVWTDDLQQTSGLCAYRELLLDFYCQRVAQIERDGFNRHYEPGSKQTVGSTLAENWQSEYPNLDIRHANTLTRSKWSPAEFRNQRYAKGWKETNTVPGWGIIEGRFQEVLDGLATGLPQAPQEATKET